ncbi:unnamed protein product [Vitrella brassicaformis CCMP3155]|uniref:Uncharacterized protein n=1 Tax=Vitrella brassicaformis (strain CCMP3155) TaxID=1169540 RepID=A0A0G4H3H5_VITBC|nr:unnamed protein product [Vitrella brassicaformis CCMP3155]|eukprot:CEM38261.1 unnamed protein product [Vitrella brassicaformis CCMP3155]
MSDNKCDINTQSGMSSLFDNQTVRPFTSDDAQPTDINTQSGMSSLFDNQTVRPFSSHDAQTTDINTDNQSGMSSLFDNHNVRPFTSDDAQATDINTQSGMSSLFDNQTVRSFTSDDAQATDVNTQSGDESTTSYRQWNVDAATAKPPTNTHTASAGRSAPFLRRSLVGPTDSVYHEEGGAMTMEQCREMKLTEEGKARRHLAVARDLARLGRPAGFSEDDYISVIFEMRDKLPEETWSELFEGIVEKYYRTRDFMQPAPLILHRADTAPNLTTSTEAVGSAAPTG